MNEPAPRRAVPLALAGAALLVVAVVLVAVVVASRPRPHVDAGAEATAACRDFEDVYGATKPGTPMNGSELASRLEQAIDHMHRAASGDAKWRSLAASLDDLGQAVNAGDAPTSYEKMQDVHAGCGAVLNPPTGRA